MHEMNVHMYETFSIYSRDETRNRARQHAPYEHIFIFILTKTLGSFATILTADSDPNDKNSIRPYETKVN